ncbi:hypothetical protein QA640_09030 [Bradyrhizobium sp. CB82]|nr:hypothetical protein [Bradyrhizobium sp. CB82]WFU42586.1 hypothetical protein QA640_09030 [Bradyrhizobium sp. CB82]
MRTVLVAGAIAGVALSIALRMIKKHYPHEWIISFADGCQCGE